MSDLRTVTADCLVCGSKFAMTDSDSEALLQAFQQWDARHKHQGAHPRSTSPTGSR